MTQSERIIQGRYRVIYPIEEQSGIVVSNCRDEQTGALVYVAECPVTTTNQQQRLNDIFGRLQGMSHPALAQVIAYHTDDQNSIAVCAAPSGQSLSQTLRVRNQPFESKQVLTQLAHLTDLLGVLHAQALFVGVLRPEDIYVQEDGNWCVVPFALIRRPTTTPSIFQANEVSDTAHFTPASDIYTVAMIAYVAATNHTPAFADVQANGTRVTSPRTYNSNMSEMFESVLLRALQDRSYNRYQNTSEMRVSLETLQILRERETSFNQVMTTTTPVATPDKSTVDASLGAILPGNYVAPTAQAAPATAGSPPQSSLKLGCLIAAAVTLAIVAIMLCIVLLLVMPGSPVRSLWGEGLLNSFSSAATSTPAPSTSKAIVAATPTVIPVITGSNRGIDEATAASLQVSTVITNTTFGPVAWSPDGRSLAITAGDTVTLHDSIEYSEYAKFEGHLGSVTSLSWSPDSRYLASGASNDAVIHVWDTLSGEEAYTLRGHDGWIRNVAFSPDGTLLASGSTDLNVRIWDVATRRTVFTMTGNTDFINGLAWSPDGTQLASSSRDGSVKVWSARTGMVINDFAYQTAVNPDSNDNSRYWATGLVWSNDGTQLFVGNTGGGIDVLDATTGRTIRTLNGHRSWITIRGLQLSADDSILYSSGLDGYVTKWDVASGRMLAQYAEHELGIFGISLEPNGDRLVSTSDQEGRLVVWDLANEQVIGTLRLGTGIPVMVMYAPDGAVMAITGYNSMVRLEQTTIANSSFYLSAANNVAQSITFVGDNRFAIIDGDGAVNIYTPDSSVPVTLAGVNGQPIAVAAPTSGALLAVSTATGIQLWDETLTGTPITLQTTLANVIEMTFSADGRYVALRAGGDTAGYEIWDINARQRIVASAEKTYGVHFLADAQRVVVITDGQALQIRSIDSTSAQLTLETPDTGGFISAVAIPNSDLIAVADLVGTLSIITSDGTVVASYAQSDGITALAVNSTGTELAVGLRDGSVSRLVVP